MKREDGRLRITAAAIAVKNTEVKVCASNKGNISKQNAMKVPQWYAVEGSDTTMMTNDTKPVKKKYNDRIIPELNNKRIKQPINKT